MGDHVEDHLFAQGVFFPVMADSEEDEGDAGEDSTESRDNGREDNVVDDIDSRKHEAKRGAADHDERSNEQECGGCSGTSSPSHLMSEILMQGIERALFRCGEGLNAHKEGLQRFFREAIIPHDVIPFQDL